MRREFANLMISGYLRLECYCKAQWHKICSLWWNFCTETYYIWITSLQSLSTKIPVIFPVSGTLEKQL
jgi:hypothetical protein